MKAFYAELAKRKTIVDPTLTVWEPLMTSDGSTISPEYAPFADIAPPAVARGWKIGGYPLFDGLTRDDFRKSFDKMVGLVGRLHKAGVRIVAGTDGYGLELVRELELYQQAGLTNAEALQTATIVPARMTGMDDRTGSIAKGKTADIILVDGDVSKDLGNLRHVATVFHDGYRLDAQGAARGERPQRHAEMSASFASTRRIPAYSAPDEASITRWHSGQGAVGTAAVAANKIADGEATGGHSRGRHPRARHSDTGHPAAAALPLRLCARQPRIRQTLIGYIAGNSVHIPRAHHPGLDPDQAKRFLSSSLISVSSSTSLGPPGASGALAHRLVGGLDHQEDDEGEDQEADDIGHELAPAEHRRAGLLERRIVRQGAL